MKLSADLQSFCDRLGYQFRNKALIIEAMTHSSLSTAQRSDNQRLEFLGDRVLGLVISEALLNDDRKADEGTLAPRFNALVRKEACAEVAESIDLGAALKMGRSEMLSGGRRKRALLGDAMEAVLAAIYLDAGYDEAKAHILRLWGKRIGDAEARAHDAKTALQEWAQGRGMAPPAYEDVGRTGPDHAPVFEVEVALESGETARAEAPSKRAAQQAAAEKLLKEISND
ncbi:ribonuclease III [Paracoccaceae bacterium GXU_MW_L88]